MKNIYEILASIGVEVPEDKKTDLDKELTANYKAVADYEKQTTKVTSLTEQLTAAKDGLKAFEGVDVNDLKGQITKLQGDLTAKDTEYQSKIADMEFNGLLTSAITVAKGKNAKAVMALLDMDALKSSKNQADDIKTALEALQKDNGYLFDTDGTPPPYSSGTGKAKLLGDVTKESFAKMGYRERLELKETSPEIYERMKE